MIRHVIISAPFGNYISPKGCTPTLGTYTVENRGGLAYRFWRCVRTLRPLLGVKGWVNKLGLPNPGLQHLINRRYSQNCTAHRSAIISVKGFCEDDWRWLLAQVHQLRPLAVELNISCPNVTHGAEACTEELKFLPEWFEKIAEWDDHEKIIVKLPPVGWLPLACAFYELGVRWFHCCNTIPTAKGGVSGHVLKPYSLEAIARLHEDKRFEDVTLIGGGGIYSVEDAQEYWAAGADHVAIASALLSPWRQGLPGKVLSDRAGGL